MVGLKDLTSVLPPATQHRANMDMQAAQLQQQQAQAGLMQGELDEWTANQQLRAYQRQTKTRIAEIEASPEWLGGMEEAKRLNLKGQLNDAEFKLAKDFATIVRPILNEYTDGDPNKALRMLDDVADSSVLQRGMQTEIGGGIMAAIFSDSPDDQARGISTFRLIDQSLQDPTGSGKASAASEAAKRQHELNKIRLKGEEDRKTEKLKQKSGGAKQFHSPKMVTPAQTEAFENLVDNTVGKLNLPTNWYGANYVDEKELASTYALDYNTYLSGVPKDEIEYADTPSQYVLKRLQQEAGGTQSPTPTDGFVGTINTKEEYDQLPKGARYTAPDGKEYIKK